MSLDLNFLGNLSKITQSLLAVAIIVVSIGVGISFVRFGNVSINQKVEKIEAQLGNAEKRSLEMKQAMVADPKLSETSPAVYKTAMKQIAEIKNEGQATDVPYYFSVADQFAVGKTYKEDEYGKYILADYIEDIFIVPPGSQFSDPKNREEVTFCEQILNLEYLQKVFKQDKYHSLQKYLPVISKEQQEMFDEYKFLIDKKKQNE